MRAATIASTRSRSREGRLPNKDRADKRRSNADRDNLGSAHGFSRQDCAQRTAALADEKMDAVFGISIASAVVMMDFFPK
jgi:hypothetical protein